MARATGSGTDKVVSQVLVVGKKASALGVSYD